MKIRDDVLVKAIHYAAVEQTAREYRAKGYSIKREESMGGLRADLVARKADEVIVFEFKSSRWRTMKTDTVARLRDYVVHTLAGQFKLVLVNVPRDKEITVDDIEETLYQVLAQDTSQVDALATHVSIDEVADVEVASVDIDAYRIDVAGTGSVSYSLQYGSDADLSHDDGVLSTDSFPFTFHVALNHDLSIQEVEEIDIDTSSFYE